MALKQIMEWMTKLWPIWVLLISVVVGLSAINVLGLYYGCHARWDTSFKFVKYSMTGGCLIEYPNGSGKLIPEEAIRILEEPADQEKDPIVKEKGQ